MCNKKSHHELSFFSLCIVEDSGQKSMLQFFLYFLVYFTFIHVLELKSDHIDI